MGRRPDDLAVRTLAGAVIGVAISAWYTAEDQPISDFIALLDTTLAQLEAGLPR